jgi:hypothetical protein
MVTVGTSEGMPTQALPNAREVSVLLVVNHVEVLCVYQEGGDAGFM